MSSSLWPCGLQPARLLCRWDSPGKNTGAGCHVLLQGIFPSQGCNPHLLYLLRGQAGPLPLVPPGKHVLLEFFIILIQGTVPFNRWTVPITGFLPFSSIPVNQWSCSVCVRLFATPWAVAYQAPASMEFSRQEDRRGLLFPFSRGSSRPKDRT